ncbi:MAG: transcription antitermination protein NusB [Mycoplasmataceae bacterium]|nr:transcription antitermination protein NusB [Mycoplasmataceae bacterium]
MNNKDKPYTKRRTQRMKNVEIIYKYELFDEIVDIDNIFSVENINNDQLKLLTAVQKNYASFISTAKLFLDEDWTWRRMPPLTRAIILCASVELWTLDKRIVINEYVDITKDFIPDETYRFVNKILDKIENVYDKIRIKKS